MSELSVRHEGIVDKDSGFREREADILFATARALVEGRRLTTAVRFARSIGAELVPETGNDLESALHRLAEACFGKPWSELKDKKMPIRQTPDGGWECFTPDKGTGYLGYD